MVKVPEEVKATFRKQRLIPMATADASGKPNVALVGMWWWADDETICVVDNYMRKTRTNVEGNPWVALNGWDGPSRRSFQVKGRAEVQTSGFLFEEMRKLAVRGGKNYPGRAVVVIRVEEVYQSASGPGAGERIA